METIRFGKYEWQKYTGDEGQDVYIARFMIPSDELLGSYVDDSSYDILIDNDADFYIPPDCDIVSEATCDNECLNCVDETQVAFKFRKGVFTQGEQDGALAGLWGAAVESNNRGMAAGPREESQGNRDWVTGYQSDILKYYLQGQPTNVDGSDPLEEIAKKHAKGEDEIRGGVWLRTKVEEEFGTYKNFFPTLEGQLSQMSIDEAAKEAKRVKNTMISDTSYATAIWSGIAGFYGRYPRIPYGRATAYTDHNRETFEKCYPFARKLEKEFARLLPNRHGVQERCARRIDNKFLIGEDTTFTTITVNTTTNDRNARMACHRDAGSLNAGFSNLTVISDGNKNWSGGYLVAPECRVAINVRPGDLLLIDNMRVIHGNTPINPPEGGKPEDTLRMSLVFYFREDMLNLGSWDYEVIRRQFIDDRRKNPEHPLWKPYWNGVSPSCFEQEEWYDYLREHGGEEMVKMYHPESYIIPTTLEEFFS